MTQHSSDPLDSEFIGKIDEAREKLQNYIEKVLTSPDIEGTIEFRLKQLGQGAEDDIDTFAAMRGDDIPALVEEIIDAAVEDGRNANAKNKTSYVVRVGNRAGRCAFVLVFNAGDPDATNEAPTDKGTLALMMRHQESMHTTFMEMSRATFLALREENKSKDARLQYLEGLQVNMIKMFAELSDHKFAQNLELRKIENTEHQKQQVANFLMQGVPAVLNKLVGAKVIEEPATPIEMQLEGFLRTMTPDQFQRLVTKGEVSLDDNQRLGFLELLDIFQRMKMSRAGVPPEQRSSAGESPAGQGEPIDGAPVSP